MVLQLTESVHSDLVRLLQYLKTQNNQSWSNFFNVLQFITFRSGKTEVGSNVLQLTESVYSDLMRLFQYIKTQNNKIW